MSARTSPVRDRRVIVLAAEVAETRDRKVPGVLLGLKCEWTCHIMQRLGGWGTEYSKQNDSYLYMYRRVLLFTKTTKKYRNDYEIPERPRY